MTDFELKLIVRCLAGEATDMEQGRLKVWLDQEENKIQYEEFKVIWMASAGLHRTYSPDLELARRKIQNGIGQTVKLNPWSWVGKAAAVLVIAAGLSWLVSEYSGTRDTRFVSMEEIATGPAMDSVVLSDGSKVWLNAGTTLKYPTNFSGPERRIFLTGEAFFEVAHNANKPFIVEAEGTVTKVLGTSFNIKTGEADVSVAVRTGKVLFSDYENTQNFALLEKNQKAEFSRSNRSIKKSTIDGSKLPFWRGNLFFNKTPLSEVVEKLSAYYDTPIQLDSAIAHDQTFTAGFEDESLEEALAVVCAALELRLENTAKGYRIVGAGTTKKSN